MTQEQDKTIIDNTMANTQPLTEDNFEPAPQAPYADNVAQIKQSETPSMPQIQSPMADLMGERQKQIGSFIDAYKNSLQKGDEQEAESLIEGNPEIADEALPENTESKEEAEQITEEPGNTANDEVNNEEIKKDIKAEQQGLIDWDKVKVYKPGEDTTGYGIQQEPFDSRVEENLNYDYDKNIPQGNEFETSITDTEQSFSPEIGELSDVVDYGLEDQNQYGADLPSEDETIIDETMSNTEPLSEDNFEPAPEAPYADNVVQLKQQKEQLDKELEEAEAEPVTDKQSAIRKQNRVKTARAAIANFYASNPNFNNQTQQSDGNVSTGGRVSPLAGVGNIGGRVSPFAGVGSAGSGIAHPGSRGSSKPTKNDNTVTHSNAGGGAMPVTIKSDNTGNIKSMSSSRPASNGSLTSGSFGLMASKKNGAIKVSKSSLPNGGGHVSSANTDIPENMLEAERDYLIKLINENPSVAEQIPVTEGDANKLEGEPLQKTIKQMEKLINGR